MDSRGGRVPRIRPGARLAVAAFGILLAGCAPDAGPAADWTHEARIAGTLRADSNPDLDARSEGLLTNSVETGVLLSAETKRGLFAADLGMTASYFLGEDEDLAGTGRVDPRLSVRAAYRGKTYTATASASVRTQSTAFSNLVELGEGEVIGPPEDVFATADENATEILANVSTSLALDLDPRNRLTFGVDGGLTEFSETVAGLVPTRTIGGTVGWQHQLSETSAARLSTGLRRFDADDGTTSDTLDLKAGLTTRRTPRHVFTLGAGVSAVRSTEQATGGSPEFDLAFTGDAALAYQLKRLSAELAVSQGVDPSTTEGALQAFTRASGTLSYDVTRFQRVGATVAYTRRAPLSGQGDVAQQVSLGPNYSFTLGPDTVLSLGYLFRLNQDEADGMATGNQVFLTLGHDLDF